nr:hypothetical protein GCM10020185_17740 [Pseudomonas brassicacearum subsp. brassicacearum]
MIRAQLIEFTATSRVPLRKLWSAKLALTIFLAVIEVAFDGDVVDVIAENRRHLPTLHFRNPVVRVQDENVDVLAMLAAFDGRRTGVARSGTDDHHTLATLLQHVVQQATEQLQGEVLERQGGAVEQLHDPFVTVELTQRCDGVVGKRRHRSLRGFFLKSASGMLPVTNGRMTRNASS